MQVVLRNCTVKSVVSHLFLKGLLWLFCLQTSWEYTVKCVHSLSCLGLLYCFVLELELFLFFFFFNKSFLFLLLLLFFSFLLFFYSFQLSAARKANFVMYLVKNDKTGKKNFFMYWRKWMKLQKILIMYWLKKDDTKGKFHYVLGCKMVKQTKNFIMFSLIFFSVFHFSVKNGKNKRKISVCTVVKTVKRAK